MFVWIVWVCVPSEASVLSVGRRTRRRAKTCAHSPSCGLILLLALCMAGLFSWCQFKCHFHRKLFLTPLPKVGSLRWLFFIFPPPNLFSTLEPHFMDVSHRLPCQVTYDQVLPVTAWAGSWRVKEREAIELLSPSSPFWTSSGLGCLPPQREVLPDNTFSMRLQLSLDYDTTISFPWPLMRAFCSYQSLGASASLVPSSSAACTSVSHLFISISSVNLNGILFFI